MKPFFFLTLLMLALSCKNDSNTTTIQAPTKATSNVDVPPPVPTEKLIELYESCDYIDFIFANLPFSISQEEKASIQQTIRHIDQNPPTAIDPNCPYFAQQIFQVDGEIFMDAKIFFQDGCTYYLFYEDGKAIYSASFTNEGIKFYNNIIAQAKQTSNNG